MPSIGRPPKTTVEFFSHDALASGGKTLSILENHFGHEGYSAWFKLLELLSATRNHFIDCRNSDSFEFLSARLKFTPEKLRLILQKMADTEAIDAALWQSGIIWCQNFVDRLSEVYRRREQPLPIKPDFLLTNRDLLQTEKGLLSTETPHTREIDRLERLPKIIKDTLQKKLVLPDFIDKDLWGAFLEMRVKLRKPATIKAQELLLKDLEGFKANGDDPNEVIKQSIKNSWQGLFPLKNRQPTIQDKPWVARG